MSKRLLAPELRLEQPRPQHRTYPIDDDHGHKDADDVYREAVVAKEAKVEVDELANAARAHQAEDGGVPHRALPVEENVGEHEWEGLGEHGKDARRKRGSASRADCLHRARVHRFDGFREQLPLLPTMIASVPAQGPRPTMTTKQIAQTRSGTQRTKLRNNLVEAYSQFPETLRAAIRPSGIEMMVAPMIPITAIWTVTIVALTTSLRMAQSGSMNCWTIG